MRNLEPHKRFQFDTKYVNNEHELDKFINVSPQEFLQKHNAIDFKCNIIDISFSIIELRNNNSAFPVYCTRKVVYTLTRKRNPFP